MDLPNPWDDTEEDEENEYMYGGRDGLIFLIDASKAMFEKQGTDEQSPFETSMECCKTFMLSKIISSDRDVMSIVLFGTDKSANELSAPNITTMQNLSEPSATKIKQLETILEPGGVDKFERDHGHSDDFALSDALWLCQTIFATSPYKLACQRVLLLTSTSDPHPRDPASRRQALVRAADLAQAGIELELLHFGAAFDTQLFYQELMSLATGEPDLVLPDPSSRIDELLERVCRLNYQKRALCHLDFELGTDVSLGVSLYNLVRKTTMPARILLDRATNEPVKTVAHYYNVATGETMLPAELCKSQTFGEKQVRVRFDEIGQLSCMVKPGLRLLGFKPAAQLKLHHHVKPSAFIFPNEALVKGSRTLFSVLLDRCESRGVVPLCYLTPRARSAPKLVALHPQRETLKRDGKTQIQPDGFHVVYLPYADAVRTLPMPVAPPSAGTQGVALAGAVVDALRFRYRPALLDNPKLQAHWANVEALALEHPAPRDVQDYTLPDYNAMGAKLGAAAVTFVSTVYPPQYDPMQTAKKPAFKREAYDAPGRAPPAKTANVTVDHSYVVDLHRKGKLAQLTVLQLKTYLDQENVAYTKLGAKKADLIQHLQNYLK